MSLSHNTTVEQTERLLELARQGSPVAMGELLEGCRQYLMLIANAELGQDLHAKASASDLVQDTFLQAQRDFVRFSGTSYEEMHAWLRFLLLHNLSKCYRRFRTTKKREIAREQQVASGVRFCNELIDSNLTSPSGRAIRDEERELLERALQQLPDVYRAVVVLRHHEQLTFVAIGERLNRSADAVRMIWCRALDRLAMGLAATRSSTLKQ